MKMPDKLEKVTQKEGYSDISQEDIGKYAGDYIIIPENKESDHASFENTNLWQNIPAVKNDRVIKVDGGIYSFNDPYTLDYMKKDLKNKILNKK